MQLFKNKQFRNAWLISIALMAVVALVDVYSMKSGVFGSPNDYTHGLYTPGWWELFYKINFITLLILPLTYYFVVRKDKTEAVALFLSSHVMWWFGLADALYFLFQGQMVPATLPWLNKGLMGSISGMFGFDGVTNVSLFICIAIGLGISYSVAKTLESF